MTIPTLEKSHEDGASASAPAETESASRHRQRGAVPMTRRFSAEELADWLAGARVATALQALDSPAQAPNSQLVASTSSRPVAIAIPQGLRPVTKDTVLPPIPSASGAPPTGALSRLPSAPQPPPIPTAARRARTSSAAPCRPTHVGGRTPAGSVRLDESGNVRSERRANEVGAPVVVGKGWRASSSSGQKTLYLELPNEAAPGEARAQSARVSRDATSGTAQGRVLVGGGLALAAWWWVLGFPPAPFAQATAQDPTSAAPVSIGAAVAPVQERREPGTTDVDSPGTSTAAPPPVASRIPSPTDSAPRARAIEHEAPRQNLVPTGRELALAVDELALGHRATAMKLYAGLARSESNASVYAAITRILSSELKARCARVDAEELAACESLAR